MGTSWLLTFKNEHAFSWRYALSALHKLPPEDVVNLPFLHLLLVDVLEQIQTQPCMGGVRICQQQRGRPTHFTSSFLQVMTDQAYDSSEGQLKFCNEEVDCTFQYLL